MRNVSIIAIFLLFAITLFAQNATPPISPNVPDTPVPTITFSLNWPDALPPFFSVAVAGNGRVAYQSSPKPNNQGDPYLVKFTASPQMQKKLFDTADQLKHFNGDWNYKKGRVAFTGTKTLTFKNGEQEFHASYNYSDNIQIQQVTSIFLGISETVEFGRKLAETYKFDKIGVDAVLKNIEQAAKDGRLEELQAIEPILSKIAKDTGMMNISRHRAEFLLSKVPPGASVGGQP
jgi:hypothetical protein